MGMEIERKFLVSALPEHLEQYPSNAIEQGYLCTAPVVRVRQDGDEFYLTYKGGGLLAHEEYNLPLTAEAYHLLLPKSEGTILSKRRYRIPCGNGLTAELDIFSGEFEGIVVVEVEFSSVEQAESFQPPSWFGKDVTDDPRYKNSSMSRGIRP